MAGLMPLPGLDAIGCGYQTVTGEFASIDSCEEQLFDFDKLGYRELTSPATGKTYSFPKAFVQYLDKNVRDSSMVSGETVEDFVEKLSASVGIDGNYAGFSGSVKTEFNNSSEFSRYEAYTRYQYNATVWKLSLDDTAGEHRNFLKDEVRNQIDKLNANDLYEKYGTHYVNTIKVGGRCVYSAVTNKLRCSKTQSLGIYVQAKFVSAAFGASAESHITKEKEYQKFSENSRFSTTITGGNPSAFGPDSSPKLEEWSKTVNDHPMLIDFDSRQGLIPIWKLAETEERKQELKDAMDVYFKTHKVRFNLADGPALEGRWFTGRVQYSDSGSGAKVNFTVFKPDLSDGWYWLGQRGFGPSYPGDSTVEVLAVRPKSWAPGILCPMRSYSAIWTDTGSGKSKDYNIWRPVPEVPEDYVPLGHFFKADGKEQPSGDETESLMAVHREMITKASVGDMLWNDEDSGAKQDGSCWKINAPSDGIDCGLWIGNGSHSKPSDTDVFCLKESAIHFI